MANRPSPPPTDRSVAVPEAKVHDPPTSALPQPSSTVLAKLSETNVLPTFLPNASAPRRGAAFWCAAGDEHSASPNAARDTACRKRRRSKLRDLGATGRRTGSPPI